MAFAAGRVLAFPAFYHDQGFLAVITFHDAGILSRDFRRLSQTVQTG